jgi:putative Holliday junction resolvase
VAFFCIFVPITDYMGRIIGIDFGSKRIGLAVTDPLQMFASPLKTVKNHEFEDFLKEFCKTELIEEFVIGYPVTMNNQASATVKYLNPFIRKIEKMYPGIPIHLVDERFTSGMALQTMIDGGIRKKERQDKSMIDKISASIILQSFLDKRRIKEKRQK